MTNISIRIKDSSSSIKNRIEESVGFFINRLLNKKKNLIIADIRQLIFNWVFKQPEMQDILLGPAGNLGPQLGIPIGEESFIVNKICSAAARSFSINIKNLNSANLGTLSMNFGNYAFTEFLEMPEGFIVTEKGVVLHWMDWILNFGLVPIVLGYHFKPIEGKGRSTGGIMVKRGAWGVPYTYSGTPTNNFIVRAFQDPNNDSDIQNVLSRYL